MVRLNEDIVRRIVFQQNGIFADIVEAEKTIFYKQVLPKMDKILLIDGYKLVVRNTKYYEKSEPPFGIVVYELLYDLKLEEKEIKGGFYE